MENPHWVHYIPIATTLLSLVFVVTLLSRAKKRNWAPHLMWWAIGILFYGLGTAVESTITLAGNTPTLNRLWYWAGAILGGYPLATGSVYLLFTRKKAHILTAISLAVVIFASIMVFIVPIDASKIQAHRPAGDVLMWQWVRLLTPFINIYAVIFLVGGALFSSAQFAMTGKNLSRAIGTGLIALGGTLPAIGGTMTKAGMVEALYIGEFLGLVLICIGYFACIRAPAPTLTAKLGSTLIGLKPAADEAPEHDSRDQAQPSTNASR